MFKPFWTEALTVSYAKMTLMKMKAQQLAPRKESDYHAQALQSPPSKSYLSDWAVFVFTKHSYGLYAANLGTFDG